MSELVQVFTILAFLAIGLISITVPTYAISVSHLARETAKTSEIIKKRQEEFKSKLNKLKESPETGELKKEIMGYETRIADLKTNLNYLSAKGAVGYPVSFFLLALVPSILGIYYHTSQNVGWYLVFAISFIILGLLSLGRTLRGVERAALRLPSPKFEVEFKSGTTVEKFKAGEQKEMVFGLTNIGEDLAENVRLVILFPPDFEVIKKEGILVKKSSDPHYQGYGAVFDYLPPPACIFVDDTIIFNISLKMPKRAGTYVIPVEVAARNMIKSEHKLTIEIVGKSEGQRAPSESVT